MILIGIGANLAHPQFGAPRRTCGAALSEFANKALHITERSRWYASSPVIRDGTPPPADQPWYVNGAVRVETRLSAAGVLDVLLSIERIFGRERSAPDAPRTIDLDILAFNDEIIERDDLVLPHPRLHQRAFALLPMADLAPDWRHPITGRPIAALIEALGNDQGIEVQPDASGFMGTEWPETSG